MRALLITLKGIEEVRIGPETEAAYALLEGRAPKKEAGTLESMYRLIGCDTVTGAGYPDDHHACWADDNGLLTMKPGTQANLVAWHSEPLVGKLLITGFDPETGETTEATMTEAALMELVQVGMVFP